MNTMGNHITKKITTSDNFIYLVDNEMFLCKYEKLHVLTTRKKEMDFRSNI